MSKKSKAACLAEYAALRAVCGLVNAIPYPVACFCARRLAALAVAHGNYRAFAEQRVRNAYNVLQQPAGVVPKVYYKARHVPVGKVLYGFAEFLRAVAAEHAYAYVPRVMII